QAEDGIRDFHVTGVQTCALPISGGEVEIWKGIRPRSGEEFVTQAVRYADVADGILVDGWSAKGRGGTGTSFPWHEVAARRAAFRSEERRVGRVCGCGSGRVRGVR